MYFSQGRLVHTHMFVVHSQKLGIRKNDDIQFNEYLEELVPVTLPAEAEFGKIVPYLLSWMAAEPDEVQGTKEQATVKPGGLLRAWKPAKLNCITLEGAIDPNT
ncbi:unnamed protein product [Thelazia callipaeda]|uniref:Helitron_like_N domain-containing protein n=1 Tax=Thelazia callipaeda TaxID=103827 RepID=A0A0N5D2X2_THECL|nr:unnamed protein product [Thelazia callipaeda]